MGKLFLTGLLYCKKKQYLFTFSSFLASNKPKGDIPPIAQVLKMLEYIFLEHFRVTVKIVIGPASSKKGISKCDILELGS